MSELIGKLLAVFLLAVLSFVCLPLMFLMFATGVAVVRHERQAERYTGNYLR